MRRCGRRGWCRTRRSAGQEKQLAETFRAGGMTVTTPDVESFRKPVLASVPGKFEAKWGKGLWDRIAAA